MSWPDSSTRRDFLEVLEFMGQIQWPGSCIPRSSIFWARGELADESDIDVMVVHLGQVGLLLGNGTEAAWQAR